MNNNIFTDMIRKYAKVKYTVKETNVYGVECSKIEIVFEKPTNSSSVTEIDKQYDKWFDEFLLPLIRKKEVDKHIRDNLFGQM